MAKLKVFAVFDAAVGAYSMVHTEVTRGAALRNFMDAASSENSALSKHPLDFSLFELGDFDSETGIITCYPAGQNLGNVATLVGKKDGEAVKAV